MSTGDGLQNLATTFVVVNREQRADTIAVSDSIWSELDERFPDFAGHTLISTFSFEDDWPTWEIHPKGDELVCLLSGDADLVLASDEGEEVVRLSEPGAFVIVPTGTWHTARMNKPSSMLFVTPGEGTENRETPGQD